MPGLTREGLRRDSFYDLLTHRYGVEIVGGVQTIEPTVTNEEESEALGVPLHSPAFQFERTTRAADGAIVEFVRSIYRGDRYRLVSELYRRDRAAPPPCFVPRDGHAVTVAAAGSEPRRRPAPRCSPRSASSPPRSARLLEHADRVRGGRRGARRREVHLVRLVGHGSSDNAASYGVYAFGLLPGWTAMRDSISLSVYYGAEVDFRRSCVVALSQSGQTPDVLEYVRARARARRLHRRRSRTRRTRRSPRRPRRCCRSASGPSAPSRRRRPTRRSWRRSRCSPATRPGAATRSTAGIRAHGAAPRRSSCRRSRPRSSEIAVSLAFVGRMFVIGRGPEYATAREISLKLLETCRVAAEPLTATDLVHGPVAAIDGLFPVWTIASADESLPAVREATARARAAGATLIASGTAADEIEGATHCLPVPAPPLPLLTPLLSVAPGQLLAWALAQAKGLDPDRPDGPHQGHAGPLTSLVSTTSPLAAAVALRAATADQRRDSATPSSPALDRTASV